MSPARSTAEDRAYRNFYAVLALTAAAAKKADDVAPAQKTRSRSAILDVARADIDRVTVNSGGIGRGRDFMKEMFQKSVRGCDGKTTVVLGDSHLNDSNGQPNIGGLRVSWCGIWAVDVWRRSGLDVLWIQDKGPCKRDGTRIVKKATNPNDQAALKQVKSGDIITIETVRCSAPLIPVPNGLEESIPKNANHHALVTSVVLDGQGAVIGYKVIEANVPQALNDGTGDLTAIHESYIPVAASDRGEDAVGNRYCKRITGHYAARDAA